MASPRSPRTQLPSNVKPKSRLTSDELQTLIDHFGADTLRDMFDRLGAKIHGAIPDPVITSAPPPTIVLARQQSDPGRRAFKPLPIEFTEWAEAPGTGFYVHDRLDPVTLEPTDEVGPVVFMQWQRVLLNFMFDGRRALEEFPQRAAISTLKKTGKTLVTAALGKWIAETWGLYAEVVCLGADREQAEDKLYAAITNSIELSPTYDSQITTNFGVMVHPDDPDPEHPTLFAADYTDPRWRLRSTGAQHIPNHGTVKALPMDPKGAAGGHQSAALFTEMWVFDNERARRVHTEFTPPPTLPRAMTIEEGYAGYEGESGLWEEIWEESMDPAAGARMVTREELEPYGGWPYPPAPSSFTYNAYELHRNSPDPIPLYINPSTRRVALIDQGEIARRMPWQTPAYYEAQKSDESFDRHHLNITSAKKTEFVPKIWWDACNIINYPGYAQRRHPTTHLSLPPVPMHLRTVPPLDRDDTLVLSVDGSVDDDTTALMVITFVAYWEYDPTLDLPATPDPARPAHALRRRKRIDDTQAMIREYHLWKPSKQNPMNYTRQLKPVILGYHGWILDPTLDEDSDQYVADPNDRDLDVKVVVYDNYQLHDLMTNLRADYGIWVKEFSQQTGRDVSDRDLYTAIRDRHIWHDGSRELDEHRAGAARRIPKVKNSSTENRTRLEKKSNRSKIDLFVTASMGRFELMRIAA